MLGRATGCVLTESKDLLVVALVSDVLFIK